MKFTELNLKSEVLDGLAKLGYETPTKIQEEVILEYTNGKNIIGQSQTGTGKTAAFVISLLQSIDLTRPGVQALVMAPTRELVTQIREEFLAISGNMNIRSLPVYGGAPIFKQIDMLRKGQTIVIGTPGRIIDLIERKALKLSEVEYFVLDEVDRMLDMGFVDDIDFIWNSLTSVKQSLAFSATITPEIKSIVEKYLGVNYTFIKATSDLMVEKIDHSFMEVPHIEKYDKLKSYINSHKAKKAIVFVQTKRDTEEIADRLREDGFKADCLNGDMRQRERFKALRDFQDGVSKVFVVTDVAARGLNVKNIDLVVNFDVPNDPESYIHRIGRTGRAGAEGKAIMFVAKNEQIALKNIEKRNKISIRQVDEQGNEMVRKSTRDEGSFNGGRNRFNSRSGSSRGSSRGGFGGRSSFGGGRFSEAPRGERINKGDRPSYFDSKPSSEKSFGDRDRSKGFGGGRSDSRGSSDSRFRSEYKPRTSSAGGRFGEGRSEGGFKKPFGERSERPSFGGGRDSSSRSNEGGFKKWEPREGSRNEGGLKPRTSSSRGRFSEGRSEGGFKKSFGERNERSSHFDSKPSSERKSFGNKDNRPSKDFGDKPRFKRTSDSKKPYKKKD